jgi:small subunit ribosomal protein S21
MIRIESRSGEPLEKTLKRFKKACEKEGLAKDIKKVAFYEKPSDKMRRRIRNQLKRIWKENRAKEGR